MEDSRAVDYNAENSRQGRNDQKQGLVAYFPQSLVQNLSGGALGGQIRAIAGTRQDDLTLRFENSDPSSVLPIPAPEDSAGG